MLRALVVRRTASAVELRGNVVIEVLTCSYRSTRGYAFAAVIADECAFWKSEDSASPDVEVLNAVRPGLATIPGSLLVAISSPYSRKGALWQAYKNHYGRDGDPVLVWRADTRSMNPTVPEHVIADAVATDEPAARAEWLAEFRSDLEAFVSREVVEAATVPGRRWLQPVQGTRYFGFTDPSGGGQDSFTVAVAHVEERHLLREAQRVIQWQDMHRRADLDPLGARRDLARDIHRRAQDRAARLLMDLGKPEHIETPAVGRLDLLEALVERVGVGLARHLSVKLVIPAEFHGGSLRRAALDSLQSLGRA